MLPPDPSTAEEPAPGSGTRRGRAWLAIALAAPVVVLAVVLVGLHVHDYTVLSPADEPQHIDYLIKAAHGHLVASGDRLDQEVLRAETCRRLDSEFDVKVPRCVRDPRRHLRPSTFQEEGYNTAYIHPPTYYAVSGLAARVALAIVPGHHDIITMGRLAGAAWLATAIVLMALLLAELAAPPLVRVVLLVLVVTAPTTLHATATVNPDATALASGAAVLLAVLWWERGRCHWLVPAATAGLALGLKVTNSVAVGAAIAYLLLGALTRPQKPNGRQSCRSRREVVVVVVAMVGAIAAVAVVWLSVSRAIQIVPPDRTPQLERLHVDEFPLDALGKEARAGITPLRDAYIPSTLRTDWIAFLADLVDLLLLAGVVAALAMSAFGSRLQRLALAALITMPLVGPVFLTFNYVFQGIQSPGIPPRYGLSLVPALVACASVPLRKRPVLVGAGGLAAITTALSLVQLVTR